MITTHKNRYGDIFTFTDLENGNVLWEGNFEFHRFGWPNKFDKAFLVYQTEGGDLSMEEFREAVLEYDEEKEEYFLGIELVKLVVPNENVINMVDPSGGPFMTTGDKIHGKVIKKFKAIEKGYEIIVL